MCENGVRIGMASTEAVRKPIPEGRQRVLAASCGAGAGSTLRGTRACRTGTGMFRTAVATTSVFAWHSVQNEFAEKSREFCKGG